MLASVLPLLPATLAASVQAGPRRRGQLVAARRQCRGGGQAASAVAASGVAAPGTRLRCRDDPYQGAGAVTPPPTPARAECPPVGAAMASRVELRHAFALPSTDHSSSSPWTAASSLQPFSSPAPASSLLLATGAALAQAPVEGRDYSLILESRRRPRPTRPERSRSASSSATPARTAAPSSAWSVRARAASRPTCVSPHPGELPLQGRELPAHRNSLSSR